MTAALLLPAGQASAQHTGHAGNPLAEKVRAANDRFADVEVARAEGYAPIPCVSGPQGLELIAVEYITTRGPANLEGHLFNVVGEPNRYGLPAFYELHVWAWRDNPTGAFADMNPAVSCDAATGM